VVVSRTTWVTLTGGALILTGAAFLGVWPLLWAVLLTPVAGCLIVRELRERRRSRRQSDFHWLREELLEMRAEALAPPEMPLMTPLLACPDCGVLGAHLAELTVNGAHWRRECMGCGHRWLEEDS
jgi:hypothetical protein